ncbi:MAG: TonB family protein [Chitinispirillales bacterium]|nr:TonB family protein [Chitinispirillales bacterium]
MTGSGPGKLSQALGILTFAVLITAVAGVAQTPDTRWYTAAIVADHAASNFTISTADELAGLARIVNGTWRGTPWRDNFSGKTITLTSDIDLSAYDNWVPIGDFSGGHNSRFSGTFNGGGHTISNLAINRPDTSNQGLFGWIISGRVENLGLNGVNINGGQWVGGVVGRLDNSSVANSYSTGTITGTGQYVGGVAGSVYASSSVTRSYSTASVSGREAVGGVAGYVSRSSVTHSYSAGTVSGAKSGIGGIAGVVVINSRVTNSYSTAAISGRDHVGGIVGSLTNGSSVTNNAALNPQITGIRANVGRVAGYISQTAGIILSNNAAYAEMKNSAGDIVWGHKEESRHAGASVTAAAIMLDGAIGSRFTAGNGWAIENGKLPGFGSPAETPPHLRADSAAIEAERAEAADAAARPGRSRSSIQHVVSQNTGTLRDAYNNRRETNPDLNGRITVRFAIDEFGKVISAEVVETTAGDAKLEAAVVRIVMGLEFERINKPGDVTQVTFPFVFTP